jgi:3-oxoacyl-[acyl-carrier protein] reductase
MDLQLVGRTCIITGASTGIGAGCARALAAEGARVAIVGRREAFLRDVADQIAAKGFERPLPIVADLLDASGAAQVAKAAIDAFGHVDILVNSLGNSRTLKPDSSDAEWDEAMNLNFTSTRRMTQAVLPQMRARKWGRIINITGSMEPRATNGATAAKAAVHMWSKGLSCDLAAEGITVNCIPPGRINSEQILSRLHPTEAARREFIERHIPIGYFGEPEDIGYLVAFLSSPLARYITGAVVPVDGGMHAFGH